MILLPILLVIALAAGAAGLAGFFDGDDGAATVSKPPTPQLEAPVTTPLPIKVTPKATTTAAAATPSDAAVEPEIEDFSGDPAPSSSAPAATDAVGTTP
jgi:hypothetical protein